MRLLVLSFLVLVSLQVVVAQEDCGLHLLAEVEMAGDGFMCPFLTPQVVDFVGERAHWVWPQPADSRIRFSTPLDQGWSAEEFRAILEAIGYPKQGATMLQWDTLTFIPPSPVP